MWQGPRLGFVAETGSFGSIDALSTIFLLVWLVSFFFFCPLSRYVSLRRVDSSKPQSSAPHQRVRVLPLVSFVFCSSQDSFWGFVLFLVVFSLWVGVFVVLSYSVRWH